MVIASVTFPAGLAHDITSASLNGLADVQVQDKREAKDIVPSLTNKRIMFC